MDFSAAPSAAVTWWLAASLELRRPFDVGWTRLPGIVPHPGHFDIACAACRHVLTVHVLPSPDAVWLAVDESAEAFMCGQCPHCDTITWGTIPVADPGPRRPRNDNR